MKGINKKCFVCKKKVDKEKSGLNILVNLPVCDKCKGTKEEEKTTAEFLDSLADGLVCGCI